MEIRPENEPDFVGIKNEDGKSIFISAPAKINLFLKVLGKRPDGYHNLYSWFQAVDLCDHLKIEKTENPSIEITTDVDNIPTGQENFVYQAAQDIKAYSGYSGGFRVNLLKRIPVGAGLGGGSSDVAAFIKGANRLLGLKMTLETMSEMGLAIGSDVPFFFCRGQAEVSGRGEIVIPIELPIDYRVALVTPPFEIRAAEAYRKLSLDLTAPVNGIRFKRCLQARELFGFISGLTNDLEVALRESYPILDKIEKKLIETGADIVRISGSGPTMFALYGDATISEKMLMQAFKGEGWGLKLVRPLVLPA